MTDQIITQPRKAKIGKSKRWVPKKWDIVFDQMIVLSCLGQGHKQIGEQFGYGQQHVCNILNTPQAKEKKAALLEHVRSTGISITERLGNLKEQCFRNLEHALTNEDIRAKSPLALADRSLAFLKGMGELEGDKPKEQKTTNIFLGNELAGKLIAGIEKANEAAVLHSNHGVEVKALPPGVSNGTQQDGRQTTK